MLWGSFVAAILLMYYFTDITVVTVLDVGLHDR